jgi:hypothetical protein
MCAVLGIRSFNTRATRHARTSSRSSASMVSMSRTPGSSLNVSVSAQRRGPAARSIDGNEFKKRFDQAGPVDLRQRRPATHREVPINARSDGAAIAVWTLMKVKNPRADLLHTPLSNTGCRGAWRSRGRLETGRLDRRQAVMHYRRTD